MAVDGRKLSKSLYQGSDEDHDFPCSPCSKEGKNVAAIKYCVECDENLCKKCLSDHNKFGVMKGHQVLDKVKSPSGKTIELPSQRCERHGGKLIDVYCPGHDKVGCSTCMTVEHSGCTGMSFIPDVAGKTDTSKKLKFLETEISILQSRFLTLKQKKKGDLDIMRKEKSRLLNEIKSERKRINEHLDKMEAELLQEVDATFKTKLHHIESEMKEVDDKITLLQGNLQKINSTKHENASEKYVQTKCISENKTLAEASLENLEKTNEIGRLQFEPFRNITESKCNSIGKIIHLPVVDVEGRCREIDIKIHGDKMTCDITEMCLCADDCLALVDFNNKRIKKVNKFGQVISSLNVADSPFGICQIDPSLLAVTLINDKKVQFISQKEPMQLQQSFKVGDTCRGIAYNDGLIYVCCGGHKKRQEGIGHIEVYTVSGVLLTSHYGEIECPTCLSIQSSTREIYVGDGYKGILLIDTHRGSKQISVNKTNARSTCWINESLLCAARYTSNKIILISTDGNVQKELLSEKDGLSKPSTICFDKKTSRLFVCQYVSDKMMVFTLSIRD